MSRENAYKLAAIKAGWSDTIRDDGTIRHEDFNVSENDYDTWTACCKGEGIRSDSVPTWVLVLQELFPIVLIAGITCYTFLK